MSSVQLQKRFDGHNYNLSSWHLDRRCSLEQVADTDTEKQYYSDISVSFLLSLNMTLYLQVLPSHCV